MQTQGVETQPTQPPTSGHQRLISAGRLRQCDAGISQHPWHDHCLRAEIFSFTIHALGIYDIDVRTCITMHCYIGRVYCFLVSYASENNLTCLGIESLPHQNENGAHMWSLALLRCHSGCLAPSICNHLKMARTAGVCACAYSDPM